MLQKTEGFVGKPKRTKAKTGGGRGGGGGGGGGPQCHSFKRACLTFKAEKRSTSTLCNCSVTIIGTRIFTNMCFREIYLPVNRQCTHACMITLKQNHYFPVEKDSQQYQDPSSVIKKQLRAIISLIGSYKQICIGMHTKQQQLYFISLTRNRIQTPTRRVVDNGNLQTKYLNKCFKASIEYK